MKDTMIWKDRLPIALALLMLGTILFFLSGCTVQRNTTVSTNNFRQTDYNMHCIDETKSFSQIIVCLQAQDAKEKQQNKITNDLIEESQKQ